MSNLKTAIINSLWVLAYVAIVSYVMSHADRVFGKVDSTVAAVGFLMLFVLSAGVVGLLVIGKPVFLYIDNKKNEAIGLLVATLVCLAVITALVLLYLGLR